MCNINNGGIVVKTTELDETKSFYNTLIGKAESKYTIDTIKPRNPRIKIVGVNKKYDTENY